MRRIGIACVAAVTLAACSTKSGDKNQPFSSTPGWSISSPAVKDGQPIDRKYTCDGGDLSPPLAWPRPIASARSLALIVDDPDAPAGTFTHWVLYAMAGDRTSLPEGVKGEVGEVPGIGRQGKSGFDKLGYGGPCPPEGAPHHYRFKLHALSARLDLAPGATQAELEQAMRGKIVAQTMVTGTYQRAR